jgi:hypothetical protein
VRDLLHHAARRCLGAFEGEVYAVDRPRRNIDTPQLLEPLVKGAAGD